LERVIASLGTDAFTVALMSLPKALRYHNPMRTLLFGMLLLLATAFAADRDLAGGYVGEWKSGASGNGGAIRFSLQGSGDSWKSDVAFTIDGAEVPCKTVSAKLQDGKIELVYQFELQNTGLQSTQKGTWNGTEFRGTYETATVDGQGVDSGTWIAKRKL